MQILIFIFFNFTFVFFPKKKLHRCSVDVPSIRRGFSTISNLLNFLKYSKNDKTFSKKLCNELKIVLKKIKIFDQLLKDRPNRLRVTASNYQWLRMTASNYKCLRMNPSDYEWLRLTASDYVSDCKWLRVTTSDYEWLWIRLWVTTSDKEWIWVSKELCSFAQKVNSLIAVFCRLRIENMMFLIFLWRKWTSQFMLNNCSIIALFIAMVVSAPPGSNVNFEVYFIL